jgi:AcrR family transcriptional regulator
MPYPAQVQAIELTEKARELIESEGLDRLTLASLAAAFGIAAPSLYHHFKNKRALLVAVNERTGALLVEHVQASIAHTDDPRERISVMLHAYRVFALANPSTYGLAFTNTIPGLQLDPAFAEALALPLQATVAALVGTEVALPALRGGWALVHGFVMLELSGQFRRGGDLDAAFAHAVETYIRGLA